MRSWLRWKWWKQLPLKVSTNPIRTCQILNNVLLFLFLFSFLKKTGVPNLFYNSLKRNLDSMFLNLYTRHLSYIHDICRYSQKFICLTCEKHFHTYRAQMRHSLVCERKTRYKFKGGYYSSASNIFLDLEGFGIHVPDAERFFPWFALFDYESYLKPM